MDVKEDWSSSQSNYMCDARGLSIKWGSNGLGWLAFEAWFIVGTESTWRSLRITELLQGVMKVYCRKSVQVTVRLLRASADPHSCGYMLQINGQIVTVGFVATTNHKTNPRTESLHCVWLRCEGRYFFSHRTDNGRLNFLDLRSMSKSRSGARPA